MATPTIITLPADTWTLVASNVTGGQIKRLDRQDEFYYETHRPTGEPAPTSDTEGTIMFRESNAELIVTSEPIDVYIWSLKRQGKVRVDL